METLNQKPLVVAITGASGSIYGLRFVKVMTDLGIPITLTLSHAAGLVLKEELNVSVNTKDPASVYEVFDATKRGLLTYYPEHEMTAPIASGSYPTRGMVIIPTSTTCFSKIANGISDSLIERAAECSIKEGKRLVVVPRETPMSAIHLENLLKLSCLGVRVVPAIPAFYSGAQRIEELVDFVIGKVLDQFEIPHTLYRRWTGSLHAEESSQLTGRSEWLKDWI